MPNPVPISGFLWQGSQWRAGAILGDVAALVALRHACYGIRRHLRL